MTATTAHFEHLRRLLKIEREEDRRQYEQKIRNRSITDRIQEGVCWYPVELNKSAIGIGEKWVLKVTRQNTHVERNLFQVGASVSFFSQEGARVHSVNGIVSRLVEGSMTIMLNRDEPPEWLETGKMGVDLLFDESTYDEMDSALIRLGGVKEGRIKELIQIGLGQREPEFSDLEDVRSPQLNDSQNNALSQVRAAKDMAIIHGPPGTGKTTTLVSCIRDCIALEKQTLVCAPSNAGVDIIVEKLHEQGINVIRLGHPARVTEDVLAHTLDAQLAAHPDMKRLKDLRKRSEEMRRMARQYRRSYGRNEALQRKHLYDEARNLKEEAHMLEDHMIYTLLDQASVIACTLVGANSHFLERRHFKSVFIDESSQAMEPAAWIPILRSDRVIMAGDHQQLPPTIKSVEAMDQGLGVTLFERCIEAYSAHTMLNLQYRMHPDILHHSNEKFYQGSIQTSPAVHARKSPFDSAIEFIDTAGCGYDEQVNPDTLSTYNTEEAEFALRLLHAEIAFLDESLRIGIIAPYKAQIEVLKEKSLHYDWSPHFLTINTVDAFQGQERDVIMISLTRSNSRGEIGFLSNQRRMNVAMTRARIRLVMIGDSATLASDSFFSELIENFQTRNSYESAFSYQNFDS